MICMRCAWGSAHDGLRYGQPQQPDHSHRPVPYSIKGPPRKPEGKV